MYSLSAPSPVRTRAASSGTASPRVRIISAARTASSGNPKAEARSFPPPAGRTPIEMCVFPATAFKSAWNVPSPPSANIRSRPAAASSRANWANSSELPALRNSAFHFFARANRCNRCRASCPRPPPAVGFARIKSGTCDEEENKVDTGPLCCRSPPELSIALPEQLQRELHFPR